MGKRAENCARTGGEGAGRGGRRGDAAIKWVRSKPDEERERERERAVCTAAVDWSSRYLRSVGEGGIKNGAVRSGGRDAESERMRKQAM